MEHECRKRTFWVAYSLDAYLSAAFGRPRAFHDEDINQVGNCFIALTIMITSGLTSRFQDLPACVDDSDLDLGRLSAAPDNALPEMAAPIAQLKYASDHRSPISLGPYR